jgi:glycosyltransferase involved in cell wall biosynthesis
VVAAAASHYGKYPLVVVGGYDGIEALPNVIRLLNVSDAQLRWLYANALAVVSLSHEDFGLTPIEGFGFGTPAVLLRRGGFLDSMIEGVTGVFADGVSEQHLIEALERLPGSYSPDAIRDHARRFSPQAFQQAIRSIVDELM